MRFVPGFVVVSCLLLVVGCSGNGVPGSTSPVGSVRVALGLYSGLLDPEWTLTAEQVAALDSALMALPDGTGSPPAGGLGYHGFTIMRPGSTLVAYLGAVASPGDGPRTVKADPTRSIERYLLETSRPHVTADEYEAAKRALAGP